MNGNKSSPLIVTTHIVPIQITLSNKVPIAHQSLQKKMKTSTLTLQIYASGSKQHKLPTNFHPIKPPSTTSIKFNTFNHRLKIESMSTTPPPKTTLIEKPLVPDSSNGLPRNVVVGAVSLGVVSLLLMGGDVEKALALGPEGPLMEEFWDNVRRYGLYALTVSTGALYTILLPIFELLKNPISAVLILVIIGGSIFIVSQILSAMFGVSDFTYSYGY